MVVVLFDLEGTLVRSMEMDPEAVEQYRTKTREKLVELGIPRNILGWERTSTLMRNKAIEYVEKHFTKEETKSFKVGMDRFLRNYELRWADNSRVFPDTIPALRKLKGLGIKMGVITNTSRNAANHMLLSHRLVSFFKVVITREDVSRLKPDPEGIRLALKRLNARKFVLVGDLVYDSNAAKNAGGLSVIVNRDTSRKLEFQADYVVGSLMEVLNLMPHLQ